MRSAKLALQSAVRSAIVAQLTSDGITAEVVVNPTQGGAYPYVVVLPGIESDRGSPKDSNISRLTQIVNVYSDSLTTTETVSDSILQAIGRDVSLTLASPFYHFSTELETSETIPDRAAEGAIYTALMVLTIGVGHIPA